MSESKCNSVLLLTIQDNANIGNRLQNYALQHVIETRYGLKVINLDDNHTRYPSYIQKVKQGIKLVLGMLGWKTYKIDHREFRWLQGRIRRNREFSALYIHNRLSVSHDPDFLRTINDMDICLGIVGSDQVWHHWDYDRMKNGKAIKNEKGEYQKDSFELPYYYLEFLPKEKRYAYGASFGFTDFPKEDRLQHEQGLHGMTGISCREVSGCRLVRQVTGMDVPHVADPTLLLTMEEWKEIENAANAFVKSQEHYVFLFFLGEITDEYREEIGRKSGGKKVIDFYDRECKEMARCGPAEFLYLIDHADYVFTDSFHGTVFSILFGKDYISFKRRQDGFGDMFGRIEELLISTRMEQHSFTEINKENIVEPLEELIHNSFAYLDGIMKEFGEIDEAQLKEE